MSNPILCLDFDGVIHDYREGWKGGAIYGELTPGFLDWAHQAGKLFDLVIYSSRSKSLDGRDAMASWIATKAFAEGWQNTSRSLRHQGTDASLRLLHARRADVIVFKFAHEKPPAFLTIDDRCIRFTGVWGEAMLPHTLRQFKPWMMEDNNAVSQSPTAEADARDRVGQHTSGQGQTVEGSSEGVRCC